MPDEQEQARLTDEQSQMVVSHHVFAERIACKFTGKYPRLSAEFHSAAALALCQAAISYVASRNTAFKTHACNRVRGACLDVMRGETPRGCGRNSLAQGKAIPEICSIGDDWGYAVSPDPPIGQRLESTDYIKSVTRDLPGITGEVVQFYYCHQLETKEIAVRLGVPARSVRYHYKKAIKMLSEFVA